MQKVKIFNIFCMNHIELGQHFILWCQFSFGVKQHLWRGGIILKLKSIFKILYCRFAYLKVWSTMEQNIVRFFVYYSDTLILQVASLSSYNSTQRNAIFYCTIPNVARRFYFTTAYSMWYNIVYHDIKSCDY